MSERKVEQAEIACVEPDNDQRPGTPIGDTPEERLQWVERYVSNTTRILDERAWPKKLTIF